LPQFTAKIDGVDIHFIHEAQVPAIICCETSISFST